MPDCLKNKFGYIRPENITQKSIETKKIQENWTNIDFSSLTSFGFKKSHIKQIINNKTTLTPKKYKTALNVMIGH